MFVFISLRKHKEIIAYKIPDVDFLFGILGGKYQVLLSDKFINKAFQPKTLHY